MLRSSSRLLLCGLTIALAACSEQDSAPTAPTSLSNSGAAMDAVVTPSTLGAGVLLPAPDPTSPLPMAEARIDGLPDLRTACGRSATGVAFDGDYYYVAEGGAPSQCIGRYDTSGNLVDFRNIRELDFRGVHWNPTLGTLVARTFGGSGGELYTVDYEAGTATRLTDYNVVPLNSQSPPALELDAGSYWVRSGNTMSERDLADGSIIRSFPVEDPGPVVRNDGPVAVTNLYIVTFGDGEALYYERDGTLAARFALSEDPWSCFGQGLGAPVDGSLIGFDVTCQLVRIETSELGITVELHILPGSDDNPTQVDRNGVLPVAILGSEDFDVERVDRETLAFGPGEAAPFHRALGHLDDVNDDGFLDLVSHYRVREVALDASDTEACVTGATLDGTPLEGCDLVTPVGTR